MSSSSSIDVLFGGQKVEVAFLKSGVRVFALADGHHEKDESIELNYFVNSRGTDFFLGLARFDRSSIRPFRKVPEWPDLAGVHPVSGCKYLLAAALWPMRWVTRRIILPGWMPERVLRCEWIGVRSGVFGHLAIEYERLYLDLSLWRVDLQGGDEIEVVAHEVREDSFGLAFSLYVEGGEYGPGRHLVDLLKVKRKDLRSSSVLDSVEKLGGSEAVFEREWVGLTELRKGRDE